MEDNRLQKGIAILYDMEKNNYLMTRAISQLNQTIKTLGSKKNIAPPVEKKESFMDIFLELLWSMGILIIFGGIIGAISGVVYSFSRGILVGIMSSIFSGICFGIVGGIVGLAIALILSLILGYMSFSRKTAENQRSYEEAYQKYNALVQSDNQRVSEEIKQKKHLREQRDLLVARKIKSVSLLNSFYETIGIDAAYRNIVPIGYMYEFSRLGISRKLEGADGLYYLIMQELRADELKYTLQEISEKLDMIIDQQREIYRELHSINEKCDRMIKLAEKAVKIGEYQVEQSEIAAYNLERIRKEEEFQSFMQAYTFYTIHKND